MEETREIHENVYVDLDTAGNDESRRGFVTRLDGYLRDTVELEVFTVAPIDERRDQLVAGVATLGVVAWQNGSS